MDKELAELDVIVDGFSELYEEFCRDFEKAMEDEIKQNELQRLSMTMPEFPASEE